MVGRGKRIRFSKLSLATGQVGGYPDLHEILSPKTKPKAKQNMGKKPKQISQQHLMEKKYIV